MNQGHPQGQPVKVKSGGGGCIMVGLIVAGVGVVIIGILAAIAIPNFLKFQCRSKQSEVKVALKSFYVAQEAYFAEHGKYGLTAAEVDWKPFSQERYEYRIVTTGEGALKLEGKGIGDMDGDLWTIESGAHLSAVNNVCR